jgi:4-hydroxythreonine-4-phosphate dehydrogenase
VSVKPSLAISIGDLNGVGIEIALKEHRLISQWCHPIYCVDASMAQQAAQLLHVSVPDDFTTLAVAEDFKISAGSVDARSGRYSFDAFMKAIALCESAQCDGVVTLPIHKEAWAKAGLDYVGHTDVLRRHFQRDAIMMLGCDAMYVALFTEHIPLHQVALHVTADALTHFLINLDNALPKEETIGVLGLNPHAGDNGVLGNEEIVISEAIDKANTHARKKRFVGPLVPDTAFTPHARSRFRYYVALYHDQGLIPLKALYFDESINISLNLPIIRTSVDHGTAFDIAYTNRANPLSYHNAIKAAIAFTRLKVCPEA